MRFVYTRAVISFLNELVDILYEKNYFGFKESAKQYVDSLTEDMESTIHLKHRRKASAYFSRYGRPLYFVSYPRSKNTTWYFFFTWHPHNGTYVIRYVTNNHVAGHLL